MSEIILASGSPRRKQLLEQVGYTFKVLPPNVDETNPEGMPANLVPEFLAMKKAKAVAQNHPNAIIIASDTIVILDGAILGKPTDKADAVQMLKSIAGKKHEVVSGVCIIAPNYQKVFSSLTEVYFRPLTDAQIDYYINTYNPVDKAGSYAIQEWIGMVGIEKIHGDYYNVMGLPISEVHNALQEYFATVK
jgi:septum formation protein